MYIVLETQTTNGQTTVVTPIFTTDNLNTAYNKYYTILAAAAQSNVDIHSAMIISPKGDHFEIKYFDHRPQEAEE